MREYRLRGGIRRKSSSEPGGRRTQSGGPPQETLFREASNVPRAWLRPPLPWCQGNEPKSDSGTVTWEGIRRGKQSSSRCVELSFNCPALDTKEKREILSGTVKGKSPYAGNAAQNQAEVRRLRSRQDTCQAGTTHLFSISPKHYWGSPGGPQHCRTRVAPHPQPEHRTAGLVDQVLLEVAPKLLNTTVEPYSSPLLPHKIGNP